MAAPVADPKKQRARRKLRLELLAAGPHEPPDSLADRSSSDRVRSTAPATSSPGVQTMTMCPPRHPARHDSSTAPMPGRCSASGSPTPRLSWTVAAGRPRLGADGVRDRGRPERRRPRPTECPGRSRCWCRGRRHRSTPASAPRSGCGSRTGATWSPWSDAGDRRGRPAPSQLTGRPASSARSASETKAAGARFCPESFEVPGEVRSARLYATAHGIYAPSINGRRVDDTVLAPGWTSYQHRLRYHAYDVTHLIQPGENVVEVLLGNGWYRGRLGYTNDRALYGRSPRPARPARGHDRRRRRPRPGHGRHLARARERDPRGRPLRRSDDRPASPRAIGSNGRCRGCRGGPVEARRRGRSTDQTDRRAAGPQSVDRAVRRDARRLRSERRRMGAAPGREAWPPARRS